mgnify:CR=1 FL=1
MAAFPPRLPVTVGLTTAVAPKKPIFTPPEAFPLAAMNSCRAADPTTVKAAREVRTASVVSVKLVATANISRQLSAVVGEHNRSVRVDAPNPPNVISPAADDKATRPMDTDPA